MEEKDKKSRQVMIVPAGVTEDEVQSENLQPVMSEFDIQKTAESENFYPAISQGYPVCGFKDVVKKDIKR